MRWHQLIEGDPRVRALHRACQTIYAAEDLWVEEAGEEIFIDLKGARVFLPIAFPEQGEVLEQVRERYRGTVEIRVEEPPGDAVGLRDSYHEYVNLLRRLGSPFLAEIRRLTHARGREHAFILFLDTEAAMLLEGEGDRIVLPELRSCVFAHTHPGEHCLPSPNDIKSSVGFFSSGGIVELIVSSSCTWMLWRSWLLAEEDIEALFETAGLLDKAYRGARVDPFQPLSRTVFRTSLERS